MSESEKNKGGRPRCEIDYATLDKLCSIQCTGEEIASILDIDYDTLNTALKREGYGGFSEYFKKKSAAGKMSLRRKQISVAMDGSVPMLIWMGKQHLGQRDGQDLDLRSSDGSMTPTRITRTIVDPKSDESKS